MRPFGLSVLLSCLLGCGDKEDEGGGFIHDDTGEPDTGDTGDSGDTGEPAADDFDGDGFTEDEGDCDDATPTVSPAAIEVCDELDNDCDDDIDEEPADGDTWYADFDDDGYGDDSDTFVSCEEPSGYVADNTDCDDTDDEINPGADPDEECVAGIDFDCDGVDDHDDEDLDGFADCDDCDDEDPTVNPDADEVCDGQDNDCDDEVDDDPVDVLTLYADKDADGYGDPDIRDEGCEAGPGQVTNDDDCDDSDNDTYLGAPETCDDQDNDCDSQVDEFATDPRTFYADNDLDGFGASSATAAACDAPAGYVEASGDCDDADPEISPGAEEICDGADNDCDGSTDADAADRDSWYADEDGDGFGDPDDSQLSCTRPSGYIADDRDCDDSDPAVTPLADEVCDGQDNDCDNKIDDYDASLVDGTTWYRDLDQDDYGDEDYSLFTCAAPKNYTGVAGDCDDKDASSFPDNAEVCDFADNDCDGETDEDLPIAGTYYADDDGDGYGDSSVYVDACAAPDGYVEVDGDCDDADAAASPGETEACDGIDNDCDDDIDESGATGESTFYLDDDEDGFGQAAESVEACDLPDGYADTAGDCDDTEDEINPAADEVCNDEDDDCDGDIDEDTASDVGEWYVDTDDDGYGQDGEPLLSCDQPSGYADEAGDCADDNEDINPGTAEVCNDVDDDCDGDTDESSAADAGTYYPDEDGDEYGTDAGAVTTCDPPADYADVGGDCDDGDDEVNPAAADDPLYDGVDQDCDGFDGYDLSDLVEGDLVITEIMVDPAGTDTDAEWFEVYNASGLEVNLEGLEVSDAATDYFSLGSQFIVEADERIIFGSNADMELNDGVEVDWEYTSFTLSNTVDEVYLAYGETLLDSVEYDADWTIAEGYSLNLDEDHFSDNEEVGFWCASETAYGASNYGTPSGVNEACPIIERYNVGNDEQFTGTASIPSGTLIGMKVTLDSDATLDQIGVIVATPGSSTGVKMAVYEDNGGVPGARIAASGAFTYTAGGAIERDVTDVELTAGTYWVAALFNKSASVYYSTAAGNSVYNGTGYSAGPPDPFGTTTSYTGQINLYMVVFEEPAE